MTQEQTALTQIERQQREDLMMKRRMRLILVCKTSTKSDSVNQNKACAGYYGWQHKNLRFNS